MQGVCAIVATGQSRKNSRNYSRSYGPRTNFEEGRARHRASASDHARERRHITEVSEWKSHAAIEAAHKNPNVLAMWGKFFALCDCVPLKTLAEAEEMFAGFEPVGP
jgi:hypothetical protein